MTESAGRVPVYFVGPAGPFADRVCATLELPAERRLDDPSELEPGARPPGLVLLDRDGLPEGAVLHALDVLARSTDRWVPVLVHEGDDGVRLRVLSIGEPETLDAVLARRRGEPGALVDLAGALEEIARARHDINNPLTSAMAETQLLLMDAPEGEPREALETIQEQLRRIRDLVAATGHLRPPRRPEG